ncbi:MAG: GGDEF domain-containing protein [Qipengyuania sp.]|nr:GGDEF domain-containing protein [Qipengyuania sp.]
MRGWAAYLIALLGVLCAAPATAAGAGNGAPLRSDCHAEASLGEDLAAVASDRSRWRCGGGEPAMGAERALLRFSPPADGAARFFGTRSSLFERLTLAVIADGRIVAQRSYSADQLVAGPSGRMVLVPLPAAADAGDTVVAAFEAPTTRGLFTDARLHARDPMTGHDAMIALLLAAMVCGILVMPLAFNAAYYRVLRERFVLWHLAVSAGLLVQCLLTSGVLSHFVALPVAVHARLVILSFGFAVAAAAAFGAAFIEPRKLHHRLRRGLLQSAGFVLVLTMAQAFVPRLLGPAQTAIYYASFVPVMILFGWAMADAWKRGSRAVRYQVVGWTPFMIMGVIRIVTMINPAVEQNEAIPLFYVAMVVQSIATSLGVADRFMIIKRQRDLAMTRATSLERLSERDDLTGLYNRRALDGPLGNFAAQAFTGFALFDLDHFKRVNDTQGHAVGDEVLRTVAGVLDGHDNAVALRMGGEEFLLLLRGDHVAERVERLREAIPVRIAREVAELELLVTASAGLVAAAPQRDIGNDFVALYRAADDLLYEAKHNGRNLLAAVKLQGPAADSSTVAAA